MRDAEEGLRRFVRRDAPDPWPEVERRGPRTAGPERSPLRRAAVAAVALAVATAGFGLAVRAFRRSPVPAAPALPSGSIAFVTQGPDDPQPWIAVVRPDGGGLRRLATGSEPAWSPHGTRIAFTRLSEDGSYGIWVMNADGTEQRRLTWNPQGTDESPSWSPDGRTIVFARSRFVTTDPDPVASEGARDLYTVPVDGGEPQLLLGGSTDDSSPAWSPSGDAIAFVRMWPRDRPGAGEPRPIAIWILPLGGGGPPTEVASAHGDAWRPAWAPDGSWLAFDGGNAVWAVRPDGTGLRRVMAPPVGEPWGFAFATWSPDGAWLAASAEADVGPGGIHLVRFEGGPPERIPGVEGADPSWGPPTSDAGSIAVPSQTARPTLPPSGSPGRVIGQIDVGEAQAVLYAAGSVWAAAAGDPASPEATLLRIDPRTAEVLARIPVAVRPGAETGGAGMAFDGRYLWIVGQVAGAQEYRAALVRVDPATSEATTFDLPIGIADALVFDDGSLWTMGHEAPGRGPRVLRIDPATGTVSADISVAAAARWASVGAVVAVEEGIWVTANVAPDLHVPGDAALVRLDPVTGEELTRVSLEDATGVTGGSAPVLGGGAIGAATGTELLRVDPATGEVAARLPARVGHDLEFGPDGAIWFLEDGNVLRRADPATGEVAEVMRFDPAPRGRTVPIALAVAPGSVWVLHYGGTLTRVAVG